ncbi:hypothetical protein TNCV_4780041 [Trichonephila clavipes]|nr:hypothetical protein TNCV_4780041 [Trichonephila clavipes]
MKKVFHRKDFLSLYDLKCLPFGDADCCAAGPGRRVASPLVRLEERWEASDHPAGCCTSELEWNQAKSYCHQYGAPNYG